MPGSTYFGEAEPGVESQTTTDASVLVSAVVGLGVVPAVTVVGDGASSNASVDLTGLAVVGVGVVPDPSVFTYVPGAGGDGGSHHGRRRRHSGS